MTDDELENLISNIADDFEAPDVEHIHSIAASRTQKRQLASKIGGVAAIVLLIAGVGFWVTRPDPTELATDDDAASASVANDSAPQILEFEGFAEGPLTSKESFGEWMLSNRLRDDQQPSVSLVARDDDPTTNGVRLQVSAYPLDGSFEYLAVINAECGPRLQHGMIEFTDGNASFFEGRLPDTENIIWLDVGYGCTPPDPERLGRILLTDFEIVPHATGLSLRNDTDQVSFVLTDLEANPLAELPAPNPLKLRNEIARDYLLNHQRWQFHDGAGEFGRIGIGFPADGSDEWLSFSSEDDPLDVIQLQTGCAGVSYTIKWNAEGFQVVSPFVPSGPQEGETCDPSGGIAAAAFDPGTQVTVSLEDYQVLLTNAVPGEAWTISLSVAGTTHTQPDDTETAVDIVTGDPEGGRGWNALSSFTLQYDPDLNCLYHDEPDNNGEPGTGGRVVIVWPAGYSAVSDAEGIAVLNPAGNVVARSGETFQIGGGMRTGGSGHCDSIGEWIANGGPNSDAEQEPAPTTTTDFSSTPTGDWTVRSVVVDGVELLHPTNAQTLTIMDGTVSANDGCNTWSGPAQWDGSGVFTLTGNSTGTARACINGQENADAFNAALRATIRWAVTSDGVLLLISRTSLIELT